jgi:hypothetical protein
VDVGHAHHYTRLSDLAAKKTGINLTVPWDKRNFVWSLEDVVRAVSATKYGNQCTVEALSSVGYPSHSGSSRPGNLRRSVSGIFLRLANVPLWRSSPLNPILVVLISKRKAPESVA